MKTITLLSILAVGTAAAGEKTPIFDKNPIIPPAPTLYSWFVGGTAGYLIDNDEDFYTLHAGVDLPEQFNGWDQALYLEVGYAEFGHCFGREPLIPQGSDQYKGYSDYEYYQEYGGRFCIDLEMIPVTINWKLEKPFNNSLNVFVGGGLGVAFMEADVDSGLSDSDDDLVFFAQVFAGLLYNVSPAWEIYGGLRGIYFDDPEFDLIGTTFDADDLGVENTDVSVDIGARFNF